MQSISPATCLLRRFLFPLALCVWVVAAPGSAQGSAGVVLDQVKIASGLGGLNETIRSLDQFGRSVCAVGDIDGDGRGEIVVGAHGDDSGGTLGTNSNVGALYVISVDANGGVTSSRKLDGGPGGELEGDLADGDFLGKSLAPLGDLDGDGIPDLAAGLARADDGGLVDSGAVLILFFEVDGSVRETRRIAEGVGGFSGELAAGDEFGSGLDALGDVDGDGVIDLAVGAREADDGGIDTGAVFILFLNRDGSVRAWQRISATSGQLVGPLDPGSTFGSAVSGLGDLDSDGVPDIAVGAPYDTDGGLRAGAVWMLFLNPDGTVAREQKLSPLEGGFLGPLTGTDEFGSSIDTLGDIDGDGLVEIAIGAPPADEGGLAQGALYVISPNTDGTVRAQQKIGPNDGGLAAGTLTDADWFGSGVAGIGDWDGDGLFDLAAGARFDSVNVTNDGSLYLLALEGTAPPPLLAVFTASVLSGPSPLTVSFTDLSIGDTKLFEWEFGDGARSATRNPTHVYYLPGTYSVTFTVRDHSGGARQSTGLGLIRVDGPPDQSASPPVADFVYTPSSGLAPLKVRFGDRTAGMVNMWSWDFGDGGTSTVSSPKHTYANPGTYTVSLTATGPGGSSTKVIAGAVSVN